MIKLSFSAPSLRWHLNVKQCELSSGDFFTIWIILKWKLFLCRSLSCDFSLFSSRRCWWASGQMKGSRKHFRGAYFYPLFYIMGILLTKQTFTYYWLCLCNGFVFALIFSRRNEYQLTDSVQYFLNNVERIAAPDYVPTLQVSFFLKLYLYLLEGWRSSRLLVFNPSC